MARPSDRSPHAPPAPCSPGAAGAASGTRDPTTAAASGPGVGRAPGVGDPDTADVTGLLAAWSPGDRAALGAPLPPVFAELRAHARRALAREDAGHTLQPTVLVHEAYLRLAHQPTPRCESRAQLFGIAARCMRQVPVDAARARHEAERGGHARSVTLADADAAAGGADVGIDVLALHDARERPAAFDPDRARLVELRYVAGLTLDETAAALGVSPAPVSREWSVARRWRRRELGR
jgi:RNA polymerase sigma factor (TIGR02999 family)